MTDAGRQELVNANKTGTNKVEIVSVGLGSRYYVTSTSQTNITNEIKRLTTIGGKVVSPDTIHVTAKDDSKDEYVVHTIGLYTNKGTLFAVYSQEQAIINKASSTIALISSDIAIKTLDTKNITFGDIEFINPPATETVVGVARFANEQEIDAGTDDSLAVSAKRLKQAIVKHEQSRNHPDATLTSKGFVQLSSATNSASETLAATPKAVKAAYDLANSKYTAQDATTARKGIVQLSSAINSTSETLAATPKAVKEAYDLAAGKAPSNHTHSWNQITNVPVASLTVRGITQLSSATNSTSETLAATAKAVKAVMDETNKKAPSNSPALTGTPTTPTAPKGTNNTQIASTAFVMAAIAALVDSSPDALNTLNELAAALGNDPNFATTMTNALAGKQPKDATLTALAGLATAADRFPYFTGNDVASLATLTKVGRDILAKSTVAAVIEYLGLQETVNKAGNAVQKTGDTLSGGLTFENDSILAWIRNTDWAKIGFKNDADSDTDSYMWFETGDNGNEYFKWRSRQGTTTKDLMTLKLDALNILVNAVINGSLGVGTTNALGGSSIVLGDNDTGFKQNGDGILDVYANSQRVFRFQNGVAIAFKNIQAGDSKKFSLSSSNTSTKNVTFNLWGASTRPVVAELGDDAGWHFYSQRNTDNSVIFSVNGQIQPSNWGNFDSRYVKDVRLGTRVVQLMARGGRYEKAGHAITGLRIIGEVDGDDEAIFRPIQKYINGTWYNVAQV
ncbi:tail fiber protein [Escherichia coli]|nr:phage tail protein [Escherichia coli]EEV1348427.1 phage tail protein [Escherichia coli]EEX3710601.1 phage tail protein [Escherichia coli]EIS6472019.1 tail fiber protein [Escherichia coli]EJQ1850354.1 tail fiber protein [Escherichia coli]